MAIYLNQIPLGAREYNDYAEYLGKKPSEMTSNDNHKFAQSKRIPHVYRETFHAYGEGGIYGSFNMKNVGDAISKLLKDDPGAIGYGPSQLFAAIGGTGGGSKKREKYGFTLPIPSGPGITSGKRNNWYSSVGPAIIKKFLEGYEQDVRVFESGRYNIVTGESEFGKQISGGSGATAAGNYTFKKYLDRGEYDDNPDAIRILSDRNFISKNVYTEWYGNLSEQKEQEAKDDITSGLEGYAGDKDTIDTSSQSDGDVLDFSGYKSDDASGSQTSYSGESPIDPNTQRYDGEKNTDYVKNRGKRTAGIREVLGEEIFSLGLKGEDGNLLTPEQLSQFATYTTEDGIEQPILDYERSLEQKMEQGDKDVGVDARSLLATRARQGVMGAASAGGKSVQQNIQDASLDKMSNRQQASSAMEARISSVQDKHDARAHLTKLKTELLSHDIKRKQDLYKTKAKTAIGMAGIEETAAEYAKDLIKIKSTK